MTSFVHKAPADSGLRAERSAWGRCIARAWAKFTSTPERVRLWWREQREGKEQSADNLMTIRLAGQA